MHGVDRSADRRAVISDDGANAGEAADESEEREDAMTRMTRMTRFGTTTILAVSAALILAPIAEAAPLCEGEGAEKCERAERAARKAAEAEAPAKAKPKKQRRISRKELAAATAELERVRREAVERMASGHLEECVDFADEEAERATSPLVKLEASKIILVAPPTEQSLGKAERHTRAALDLLDEGPRLPDELASAVSDQSATLLVTIDARREGLSAEAAAREDEAAARRDAALAEEAADRRFRRGTTEVIAGSGALVLSALGVGLAIGGAVHRDAVDEARDELRGQAWRDDAAPLDPLDQRGSQMIVAGAVLAVLGAGAGVPLVILGMKDRKEGRRAREEAGAIEIRPTLGGLTLRGRF